MSRMNCILLSLCISTISFGQMNYPSIYANHDLPMYDKAEIVDMSRNTQNLEEGIKIFLESDQDYSALRAFYESKMNDNGWQLQESIAIQKMRELGKLDSIPFSGVWVKEDLKYQVFTSRLLDRTKINITFLRD